MARIIGVDIETFGLTGPVYAVGVAEGSKTKAWFGEIRSRSQKVLWTPKQLEEIRAIFNGAVWVGHNIGLFDKPRLEAEPFRLKPAGYEDTLPASHVYNSLENHDLKSLEVTKLHLLRDDESDLKELTQLALNIVKACNSVIFKNRRSKYLDEMPDATRIMEFANISLPDGAVGDWQQYMWLTRVVFPGEKLTEKYLLEDCKGALMLWKGSNASRKRLHSRSWPGYEKCLKAHELDGFYGVHKRYHPVVNSMKEGIRLFREKAEKRLADYGKRISSIETAFEKTHQAEPASSKQMSELLYGKLGFPIVRKAEEGNQWPSVDRDVLNTLAEKYPKHRNIKWVDMLADYRELATDLADIEGYLKAANKDDIIAVNINPTRTKTTRGGCSEPNMQNVNKREGRTLRDLFGPVPGTWWFSYDMKQLELWIITYLSEDRTLNEWMKTGKNVFLLLGDMVCKKCGLHKLIGTSTSRSIGKTLTYGISYGAGPFKVASTIRQRIKVTIDRPELLHETFFGLFPGVRRLMGRLQGEVEDRGYIQTAQGYRLFVPDAEPHAALDYAAQGTAGWRIKEAAVHIWEDIITKRNDIRFVLDVHDQLIFQGKPSLAKGRGAAILESIKEKMESNGVEGLYTPVALSVIKDHWGNERPARLEKGRIIYERK